MTPHQLNVLAVVCTLVCWAAFALTWLVGGIYYGSRAPALRRRAGFGSGALLGTLICFAISAPVPRADWHSLTVNETWFRVAGLAILLAATAFTIWARLTLGVMWSAAPTVKEQHQLQTGGPYGITRHPIYTGILGMLLGTLFLAGAGRWIVPFPVFLVVLEVKIRFEENLMQGEFPDAYPRYRRQVPQLIPGLRLLTRYRLT
jgi:protein-S-isoprenylcysteine O-methyltransferase Ste14